MSGEEVRFEFGADGVLYVHWPPAPSPDGWREPTCPECGEPIRWVLDMASWTSPPHRLAHARCLWLPEAFHREAERVITDPPAPPSPEGCGRGRAAVTAREFRAGAIGFSSGAAFVGLVTGHAVVAALAAVIAAAQVAGWVIAGAVEGGDGG